MTPFPPDSDLVARVVPSPNRGPRRGAARPDILLLHYTGMVSTPAALERLCCAASEVSAHYLVEEDGGIVQCVPEAERAWHAGASAWGAISDVNSHAIGIEIANPGHDFGYPPFPPAQVAAVIALCSDIVARHGIRPERLLAHSDVAPARKQDPGEKFPWAALAAADLGHRVAPAPLDTPGAALRPGDAGAEVAALQAALQAYGYAVPAHGHYDGATVAVVRAFQRHFRPARVDGIADASTRVTLARLLAALPSV